MSNFLNFCSTFYLFFANLTGGPTNLLFKCDVMSPCLEKLKKRHSMEIESKCIGPQCASHI
jgi:hypothetical protein